MGAIHCQLPLPAKVAFQTLLCVTGDDWNEECAIPFTGSDRLIPGIAAAQLALVEPDLDARGPQRIANARSGLCVL
jgi:hypothetical protein